MDVHSNHISNGRKLSSSQIEKQLEPEWPSSYIIEYGKLQHRKFRLQNIQRFNHMLVKIGLEEII